MKIKITHLTSVHTRYDTRIFIKMCCSLARQENYKVNLVVADGNGNEVKENVNILDVGEKEIGRISRMTKTVRKVFKKAKELNSDIYHLHDPELMLIGLKLIGLGKKVIFDAHEDLPKQLLGKPYLKSWIKKPLSLFVGRGENLILRKYTAIITATPYIRDKFLNINKNTVDINNYPVLLEFSNSIIWEDKKNEVCYVGGIAKVRGIKELVKAMNLTVDVKLNLAGSFSEEDTEREVKNFSGWKNIKELGFLNRSGVSKVYQNSKAGIVTLHPIINYLDALPVKMFEYMAAGLPVISSNIPLWDDIISRSQCGICVDPHNPKEIADAIAYVINNPDEAKKMGENGRRAAVEKYNWGIEKVKLFDLYSKL